MKRLVFGILVVLTAHFALATSAAAGGWALVELIDPVPEIATGEQVHIDARLLQHGITPVADATPVLTATHRETQTSVSVDGKAIVEITGGYRFAVTFPAAGEWKWYITNAPFGGMTTFPTLTVTQGTSTPIAQVEVTGNTIVTIANQTFSPATLEITAGTTVTWINADVTAHQIGSTTALWFDDSPMLQPGERYEYTFDTPGTLQYVCGPHVEMVGEIIVI